MVYGEMMSTWRRRGIEVAVALAALYACFLAGRYSRPAKLVTRDVVRVEVQARDVVKVQTVHDVQVVHDVQTQTRTVTVTRWAKAPDGSPVVTQETRQAVDQDAHATRADDTKVVKVTEHDIRQVTQEVKTVSVVAERPAWSLAVMPGIASGGTRVFSALPAPVIVNASVEHRLFGPVSVGVWGSSNLAGGLTVRVDL